jgi:tetratricopeptide (TPR) repeat protein
MTRPRGQWLLLTVLGILVLAGGLRWAGMRPSAGPSGPGWDAYARADWDGAARWARQRLKAAGADVEALRLLARSSVHLGRDQSAVELFRQLGPKGMLPEDLFLLSVALHRTGKGQASLQVLEQARAADPDHAATLFELTRGYLTSDRLAEAAETGHRLAAQPGWEARAEWLLGLIHREQHDPASAVACWQRALAHSSAGPRRGSQPIVSHKELARALLQAGRPGEARPRLLMALAEHPDPEASWLLSRAAIQAGDWVEARAAWEKGSPFRDENPLALEPAPLTGSGRCVECHATIARAQRGSRHARTFFPAAELDRLDLPASSLADRCEPTVTHTLRRVEGRGLHQETRVAGKFLRAVVAYAFGSGDRGLTLVGRDEAGRARELRLSYYPHAAGSAWDVTAGQSPRPDQLEEYLGRPLTEDSVRRCLLCHVTDPRAAREMSGPGASDRGIGCERCHGPGGNHLLAIQAGFPDPSIARPGLAQGSRLVALCAQCHSPRGRKVTPDDPTSVRFQGTTLTWSRCFTESHDALDCVTCHDPHRDAETSAAHYEAQCLSCHAGAARPAPPAAGPGPTDPGEDSPRTTCPVNPTRGCIGCHMPAVSGIVPHASFTDHFIRVHRD